MLHVMQCACVWATGSDDAEMMVFMPRVGEGLVGLEDCRIVNDVEKLRDAKVTALRRVLIARSLAASLFSPPVPNSFFPPPDQAPHKPPPSPLTLPSPPFPPSLSRVWSPVLTLETPGVCRNCEGLQQAFIGTCPQFPAS